MTENSGHKGDLDQLRADLEKLGLAKKELSPILERLLNNPKSTAIGVLSLIVGGGDLTEHWDGIVAWVSSISGGDHGHGMLLLLCVLFGIDRLMAKD